MMISSLDNNKTKTSINGKHDVTIRIKSNINSAIKTVSNIF